MQQTGSGAFKVDLSIYSDSGFTVFRSKHSVPNLREVSTPEHARTFGIVLPMGTTNSWCHKSFDRPVVQMMPRQEYRASNSAGHLGYQIAIDDDLMAESLTQLELPEKLSGTARLLDNNPQDARRLVRRLDELWSGRLDGAGDARQIVMDDLAAALLNAFSNEHIVFHDKPVVRSRALNRAIDYMEAHLGDTLSLADVARDTGASRRTLTQAFKEGTGQSPMAFLKMIRLNEVHRALLRAEPNALIIDLANDAGFWHMGQFARDYFRLFCELPSETLAKRPPI